MTRALFTIVWWYGAFAIASSLGLIIFGLLYNAHDNSQEQQHVALASLEASWALPAWDPRA